MLAKLSGATTAAPNSVVADQGARPILRTTRGAVTAARRLPASPYRTSRRTR